MIVDFSDLDKVLSELLNTTFDVKKNDVKKDVASTKKENNEKVTSGVAIEYNMFKNDNIFTIQLIVPGYNKEDFNISVENNELFVSVDEKQNDTTIVDIITNYRLNQSFTKKFNLNKNELDVESVTANYENGVLNIVFDITDVAKPRTVKIL